MTIDSANLTSWVVTRTNTYYNTVVAYLIVFVGPFPGVSLLSSCSNPEFTGIPIRRRRGRGRRRMGGRFKQNIRRER